MARADLHVGDIVVPSGTLVIADTETLAAAESDDDDDGDGDGQAGVIEGLPRDQPIRVFAVHDGSSPWIDALRLEVTDGDGDDEAVATVAPAVHELILIDVDATDRFVMAGPQSHYARLKASLADQPATVAEVAGMRIGIAMLALQAVGSESDVVVTRATDGTVRRIVVRF